MIRHKCTFLCKNRINSKINNKTYERKLRLYKTTGTNQCLAFPTSEIGSAWAKSTLQ